MTKPKSRKKLKKLAVAVTTSPRRRDYSEAIAMSKATKKSPAPRSQVFTTPLHPPAVMEAVERARRSHPALAMDDAFAPAGVPANVNVSLLWAGSALSGVFSEGITFLGYPYLAELTQRPEYRFLSETPAKEMVRKWIEFYSISDVDKTDRIKELNSAFELLHVKEMFCQAKIQDGFFGRGHIFVDTGDVDDPAELAKSIGDGWDELSLGKISPDHPIQSLRTVEAVWCYPTSYNSDNPLKSDWYRPNHWFVQSSIVHSSRMLTFIGHEVPDLLKPTYSFGGISMSQLAKPYVDNWLQTRQGVNDIVNGFSIFALSSNLQQSLQADGQEVYQRAALFNAIRNNQGLMMLDKDTEDFKNVAAPLGGLEALQAQAQEHMCSVARTPKVKLLGIDPAGLNASSEGEMRAYYDTIKSDQEHDFKRPLHRLMGLIMLSLWGEVDKEIGFRFLPLWALDEKGEADVEKAKADTDAILVNTGIISPAEARKRVATDPASDYASIDVDDVPDLLGEEEQGLEPTKGGGGEGAANPESQTGAPGETIEGGTEQDHVASGEEESQHDPEVEETTNEILKILGADMAMDIGGEWDENKHKRGQPKNAGQFGPGFSGGKHIHFHGGGSSPDAPAKVAAPNKFNEAMAKLKGLSKPKKDAVHLFMHDLLGSKVELTPTTFNDAMKLLSSKPKAEKAKFIEKLHEYLDNGGKTKEEIKPKAEEPKKSLDALDDYIISKGFNIEDTDDPDTFSLTKKDGSKINVNPKTENWTLESPGHMTKEGSGKAALQALLEGNKEDWEKEGVKNAESPVPSTIKSSPSEEDPEHAKLLNSIAKARPKPTPEQNEAISSYKSSGYVSKNDKLRHSGKHTEKTQQMHDWLEGAALPEDVTLYRGISSDYSKILKSIATEGMIFKDRGFMSTTTKNDFAKSWVGGANSGNVTMKIDCKKGQKGAAIKSHGIYDQEFEVVIQDSSKLLIKSFDYDKGFMHCELIQD